MGCFGSRAFLLIVKASVAWNRIDSVILSHV